MSNPVPDLSISIINTNNREQMLNCLRSVFANTCQTTLEVFVVDNACTDGSTEAIADRFPQVRLIHNERKMGFSTNNNFALSKASGRYLMLLNDDTLVQPSAIDLLTGFMDKHRDAGVVGACLLNLDGSDQRAYDWTPNPVYEAFRPLSEVFRRHKVFISEPIEVDNVCGAAMVVRREAMEQVGLLDPVFDPLYSEEVEWCYRFKKSGWSVYHLPCAHVIHLGSQTMSRAPLDRVERLYQKKALFFRKHGSVFSMWLFKFLLFLASLGKLAIWSIVYPFQRTRAAEKIRLHFRIVQRALFL